jgi:hypothetical protein
MFDMPPPLPDGYECGPGTVPGWLNEEGLFTSCAGDLPNPGEQAPGPDESLEIYPSPLPLGPLPDAPPATTEGQVFHPPQMHVRDTLPETSPDLAGWVLAGVLLIAVGLFVALNEWRKK